MLPAVASGTQIHICYNGATEGSIYLSIYSFHTYREMSEILTFQSSRWFSNTMIERLQIILLYPLEGSQIQWLRGYLDYIVK